MRTAIFLCEITGITASPWRDAGYRTICVDPAYIVYSKVGDHEHWPCGAAEAAERLSEIRSEIAFAFAMPPCTNLCTAGSIHWEAKRKKDPYFQHKAVMVAEQCRTILRSLSCPWGIENPVGILSSLWGKPHFTFDPMDYGGYLMGENDDYVKKTCIWSGNSFVVPEKKPIPMGVNANRVNFTPAGPRQAELRSATPAGFARAMWEANHV